MDDGDPVFGFLPDVHAKYGPSNVKRLSQRHQFIIEPYTNEIAGADVLDLASHDGRWCYAFAMAGAKSVVGVEGRPELVQRFARFPNTPSKDRIQLYCGDLFDFLEGQVRASRTFDVVGVLGVFYHIMDHYRLLRLVRALRPKLVIIDGEFMTWKGAFVHVSTEDPAGELNTTAQAETGAVPIGTPSRGAVEVMAKGLGYAVEWADWEVVPPDERKTAPQYFRKGPKRRGTCALRPI